MKFRILVLSALACWVGCEKVNITPEDSVSGDSESAEVITPGTSQETPLRTIRISASSGDDATKTTLLGNRIVWDANDSFKLVNEGPAQGQSTTLRVRLNKYGSAALGFKPTNSAVSTNLDIRYGGVKVEYEGNDITSDVVGKGSLNNSYKFGLINRSGEYLFPTAKTTVETDLKGSNRDKYFAIIRVSSTPASYELSDEKTAVITIDDFEYKYNLYISWSKLTEGNNLTNGGTWGDNVFAPVADYYWVHGYDASLKLDSDAGKTYGDFIGQLSQTDVVDEKTRTVFPSNAYRTFKDGVISMFIPQHQAYVPNSFDHDANIMIGDVSEVSTDVYDAHFKNMMGVLALSLTGENIFVSEISLTDRGGKKLWGTASVSANDYEKGISSEMITSNGSSTITMNCSSVELSQTPTVFNFVVPVGSFNNGFDVTVKTVDGRTATFGTSKDNSIVRSDIKKMPERSLNSMPLATFNIENAALSEYLDMGPYSGWGASSRFRSSTSTNAFRSRALDQDTPEYYKISWSATSAPYYVTLTDETYEADVFSSRQTSSNSYEFINLIPGHQYSFNVTDGAKKLSGGKFKVEGRVRMVTIADSWNYRDLGGWEGIDGHHVQYDKIFRGGSLNGVWQKGTSKTDVSAQTDASNFIFSSTARQQILDLGIKGELDLRTTHAEETNKTKTDYSHAWSLGMNHTGIPDSEYDFYQIKTADAVSSPMTNYAVVRDVAWIIDQVVNKNHKVVFHCKSGADRTGCVAYLLLYLLGVSEGNVALEYEITNMSHEQGVVQGTSAIRDKFTSTANDNFYKNGFTTINQDTPTNKQQQAYYYLNQTFKNKGVAISSSDLDRFIEIMLGMEAGSYVHPSWADNNGNSLQAIYSTPQN